LVDHFCRASESIVLNIAEGMVVIQNWTIVVSLDVAAAAAVRPQPILIFASKKDFNHWHGSCLPERNSGTNYGDVSAFEGFKGERNVAPKKFRQSFR